MATSADFLKEYGDKTFDEVPFCDIDNLLFCEIFYMPFEKVIDSKYNPEPVSFKEACNRVFAYNGYKHVKPGLLLVKSISVKMMAMSNYKRYADIKMADCESVFNPNPAVQFAAVTLLMPDGSIVVVYRGTDDTLVGWKEDFDLYTRKGIPSHKLAIDYLNRVAKKYKGDIIICGHSKGGNLALNSALKCNKSVRARIKKLYNDEGPGFHSYAFLQSDAYKELLPKYRHFVPSNSLIGMLLAHDDDYEIVKSTHFFGPLQHAPYTWKTEGTKFATKDELFFTAKIADLYLRNLIFSMDENQNSAFDKVLEVIVEGTGQVNLTNFTRNIASSIKGAVNAWKALDDYTRTEMSTVFDGAGKMFADVVNTVRGEEKHSSVDTAPATAEAMA